MRDVWKGERRKKAEGGRERERGRERSWGRVEGYKATEQKAIGHVAFLGKREGVFGGGRQKMDVWREPIFTKFRFRSEEVTKLEVRKINRSG